MKLQESALIQTAMTVLTLVGRGLEGMGEAAGREDGQRRRRERAVERAVGALPPEDYMVLHLALRERFNPSEVAKIVGCSAGQARRQIIAVAAVVVATVAAWSDGDAASAGSFVDGGSESRFASIGSETRGGGGGGGGRVGVEEPLRVFAGLERVAAPQARAWQAPGGGATCG